MSDRVVEALIADLLAWLDAGERGYQEVIEAWRTSCPRLPVWEDANERGLNTLEQKDGRQVVRVSWKGLALLRGRNKSVKPA